MSDEIAYRLVESDTPGMHALIGEARTVVGKVATWVPVSKEMVEDAAFMRSAIEGRMAEQMHRLTHPWEFPDRNPFPHIDPVPWFTSRLLRYRAWRQRIRDAREVLRYGLDDTMADRDGWTYDP